MLKSLSRFVLVFSEILDPIIQYFDCATSAKAIAYHKVSVPQTCESVVNHVLRGVLVHSQNLVLFEIYLDLLD